MERNAFLPTLIRFIIKMCGNAIALPTYTEEPMTPHDLQKGKLQS